MSNIKSVFVCSLSRFKSVFVFLLSQALMSLVPTLIGHLGDASLSDALLAVLVDIAQVSPASLSPFLPVLRIVGQQSPGLVGYVAKIHGTVGLINEVRIGYSYTYFVILFWRETQELSVQS